MGRARTVIHIPSLTAIEANCRMQGEHRIWKGWYGRQNQPHYFTGKDMINAQRIVAALLAGVPRKDVLDNLPARGWAVCRVIGCCAHECVRGGTVKEFNAWRRSEGLYQMTPRKRAALIAGNRRKVTVKLTMEQAREIRQREGSNTQLAREFGVCHSTISKIRVGKRWREDSIANNSVFNLRA